MGWINAGERYGNDKGELAQNDERRHLAGRPRDEKERQHLVCHRSLRHEREGGDEPPLRRTPAEEAKQEQDAAGPRNRSAKVRADPT